MNYIDIILGLLLLVAAVRGFMKGFIYEVASLAALILGVWGGIHFSRSRLASSGYLFHGILLSPAAFFLIFCWLLLF